LQKDNKTGKYASLLGILCIFCDVIYCVTYQLVPIYENDISFVTNSFLQKKIDIVINDQKLLFLKVYDVTIN